MNVKGLVTAKRADGSFSWTVIAAWGIVLLGVLQVVYDSPLFDAWDGQIVVLIGVLKLVLRGKTTGPLA